MLMNLSDNVGKGMQSKGESSINTLDSYYDNKCSHLLTALPLFTHNIHKITK